MLAELLMCFAIDGTITKIILETMIVISYVCRGIYMNITLSKCYLLIIILIFLVFMVISFSIVYYFILFFVTNVVISSPHGGVLVLCQRQKHFKVYFLYIFHVLLLTLGIYTLHRCKFNKL